MKLGCRRQLCQVRYPCVTLTRGGLVPSRKLPDNAASGLLKATGTGDPLDMKGRGTARRQKEMDRAAVLRARLAMYSLSLIHISEPTRPY